MRSPSVCCTLEFLFQTDIYTSTPLKDHITPVLRNLHWLPVRARIDYKILLLTLKCIHRVAPSHLWDILIPYVPNLNLRSANSLLLTVPFFI